MSADHNLSEWKHKLRSEYANVRFESTENPAGFNAICENVLVGRFFADRSSPYGVVYAQPRSCGGKS